MVEMQWEKVLGFGWLRVLNAELDHWKEFIYADLDH